MRKLIMFVLRLLTRMGGVEKVYNITYQGKAFSLNALYTQGHWKSRNDIKDVYGTLFNDLIAKSKIEKMEEYSMIIFFNSSHDTDNVAGMAKVFVDVLTGGNGKKKEKKYNQLVPDDSKHHYKFFGICPDLTLKHNTFEFMLIKHF